MNDWLLEIMKCPLSGERLTIADAELVDRLRQQQRDHQLLSHKGIPIADPFDSGLVNQSRTYFFRIADGIPTLLPDEAVALS